MLALLVVLAQPTPPPQPAPLPAAPVHVMPAPNAHVGPPMLTVFVPDGGKIVHDVTETVPATETVTVMTAQTQVRDGKTVTVQVPTTQTVTVLKTVAKKAALDPKTAEFRTAGGVKLTYDQARARLTGPTVWAVVHGDPPAGDLYLKALRDDVVVVKLPVVHAMPAMTAPAMPMPAPSKAKI